MQTAGWVLSYSPEYRAVRSNPDLLMRITELTGGRIAPQNPAEVFAHTLPAPKATRPVWHWLVVFAVLLLPFDVAVRRLVITSADFAYWRNNLREKLSRAPRSATQPPPERASQLNTLFEVKEKVRQEQIIEPPVQPPSRQKKPVPPQSDVAESLPEPQKPASAIKTASLQPTPKPRGDQSTASYLLQKKRSRQQGEDEE